MSDFVLAEIKHANPDKLNEELAEQWRLLCEDEVFRADAEAIGIDLAEVDAIGPNGTPFEIEKPENQSGGIGEAILIKVAVSLGATAAIELAKLVWARIIKPAVNYGGRQIKEKSSDS